MVNKIITGISQTLDAEFNTGDTVYSIYSESIEQGFDEPCFSILNLTANEKQLMGNRYSFTSSFDIQYFPSNEPIDGVIYNNKECYDVAIRLMDILRSITVNSKFVRGTKINHEVINDVLHFFVNYDFITKRETIDNTEKMQTLTNNTTLS